MTTVLLLEDAMLPFVCECDRHDCCATVRLSAGEHDTAQAHALRVLADRHRAAAAPAPEPAGAKGQT